MKKVTYVFEICGESVDGCIDVPDCATSAEIDQLVIDAVLSSGQVSYNWTVSCDDD